MTLGADSRQIAMSEHDSGSMCGEGRGMAAASMAGLWRNADGVQGLVHTSHPMTRSCYRIITIKPVLTEQHETGSL